MIILMSFFLAAGTIVLIIGLPWVLTYIPGKKEDREWLNYVWNRTRHNFVYWWVHENRSGIKVLRGRDINAEDLHELHIHTFSARFLYSYSMKGAEEDGYTHNKKKVAYISIQPWWPLNRLTREVLKQLHDTSYAPPQRYTPAAPLFGLRWGEEPEWRRDVRL